VLECLRLSSPSRIAMIELNSGNIPYLKSISAEGKAPFVHCADFLSVNLANRNGRTGSLNRQSSGVRPNGTA
jgi:hypothetical protein